jgi:Tol biopolymer transport system component
MRLPNFPLRFAGPPGGVLAAALLVAPAALPAPAAAAPGSAPPVEVIAYAAMRPANWDLYLFEEPGGPPRRLTRHPALDYNAVFSPDGRWIVFTSERRGNPDLWTLDLENPGEPILLTGGAAMEDAATISPDGKRIAFVSTEAGFADIYLMPFRPGDSSAFRRARNLTLSPAGDFNPAFSPDGGRIAFSSNRDDAGASDIYLIQPDGTGLRRLTDAWGWDGSPAWSADGQSIYFYSQRNGPTAVWRMGADGSKPTRVTNRGTRQISPAISPAGRIAFAARDDGARWRIRSITADGSGERTDSNPASEWDYWAPDFDRRTGRMVCHGTGPVDRPKTMGKRIPGPFAVAGARDEIALPDRTVRLHPVRGFLPSFSPDGRRIASDDHFARIVLSDLDGGGLRELFRPESGEVFGAAWSGDGTWIAFTAGPTFAGPGAEVDIWKIRPDGTGAIRLTPESKGNDAFPQVSADGRRIVFRSGRDGNQEIYLMNADGTGARRLTDHPAIDTMPAFSPRGDQIAFSSRRDGDYEIYTLDLDGEGRPGRLVRRTESPDFDMHPRYSPDGKWIVFASARHGVNDERPLTPVYNPQPYGEIYALRLSDGLVLRLTHNRWEDGTPAWAAATADE